MKGMPAIGRALRGLARMLLGYLQKKRQLENKHREGTFRCQPIFNSSSEVTGDTACTTLHAPLARGAQ
jgi:hypothetical protein